MIKFIEKENPSTEEALCFRCRHRSIDGEEEIINEEMLNTVLESFED